MLPLEWIPAPSPGQRQGVLERPPLRSERTRQRRSTRGELSVGNRGRRYHKKTTTALRLCRTAPLGYLRHSLTPRVCYCAIRPRVGGIDADIDFQVLPASTDPGN